MTTNNYQTQHSWGTREHYGWWSCGAMKLLLAVMMVITYIF